MTTLVPDKNFGIVILANFKKSALPEAIRALRVERLLHNSPEFNLIDIAARRREARYTLQSASSAGAAWSVRVSARERRRHM